MNKQLELSKEDREYLQPFKDEYTKRIKQKNIERLRNIYLSIAERYDRESKD